MPISIIIGFLLLYIFYHDLKYRAIYWWAFPILAALSIYKTYHNFDAPGFLFNALFITSQLGILYLVFSLKNKKLLRFNELNLGLGDILMFLVLTLWFSPLNYIIFFLVSLVLSIVLSLIVKQFRESSVPLAGLQSVFLLLLMVVEASSNNALFFQNWITL